MAASVEDSSCANVEDDPVEVPTTQSNNEQHNPEVQQFDQQQPHVGDQSPVVVSIDMTSHGTMDDTSTNAVITLPQSNQVSMDPEANADDVVLSSNQHSNDHFKNENSADNSNTDSLVLLEKDAQKNLSKESCTLPQDQHNFTDIPLDTNQQCNAKDIRNSDLLEEECFFNTTNSNSDNKTSASPDIKKSENEINEGRPVREMLVRRVRSASTETSCENKPVLETLTFNTTKEDVNVKQDGCRGDMSDMSPCLLCERSYPAYGKDDVLAHLIVMHKFVIADVNFIANLPAYLKYWKKRMQEQPFTDFCSKIVTNSGVKDSAQKEEFYLLCDALPEDKSLREHLQRKKLEAVLLQQQKEREETKFCRQCLFCKQTYCGNRAVLFDHLLHDHTFHMGQPDNLVFTDELFDLIQSKLDNQLCLFCEKSFKDKASLREHMRKKQHRKINPKNKEYDRFYIINYMEMGKNWESLQSEDNRLVKTSEKGSDEEDEWAGWEEEYQSKVVCLFCDTSMAIQADLQKHMKDKHGFDLLEVNHKLQLNFYQKVKLINYIRRQVYHKSCYGCQERFTDTESLNCHIEKFPEHLRQVPNATVWDQPQYFFPTYEDDTLLCQLDDDDDGASGDALGVTVYAEDIHVSDTILSDQRLIKDLSKA